MQDSTFIGTLTGGYHLPVLMAYLVLAFIASTINMLIDFFKRKPLSPSSPEKASFKYWWGDNWSRFVIGVLAMPLLIIGFKFFTGYDMGIGWAIVVGLGGDRILELLKAKKLIPSKQ